MSPARKSGKPTGSGGNTGKAGNSIAIPVPTTPAVVPVPPHERAWDVSGAWPAWVRYAVRQIPAAVVSLALAALAVLILVEAPFAETWCPIAIAAGAALLVSRRPRRALRAYRVLRRQKWTLYGATVSRTESEAWIVLQQARTRANAHVVANMRVQGGKKVREEVATPAYEHVWFAGDPRRGGVVVPAGGGPIVYVGTFIGASAPAGTQRVSNTNMPAGAVRPTLVQLALSRILSPATRRDMAARAYARQLRRDKKAAERRAAAAAAVQARVRKRAEWERTHPEQARRAAERARRDAARYQAERERDAVRRAAQQKRDQQRQATKAAKPTVANTLRARQQAKAMRDNFNKRG